MLGIYSRFAMLPIISGGILFLNPSWQEKTRRYYCDFFVADDNLVVEIKSLFTLSRDLDIVKQKILSAQTKGYKVLLLVFDRYGRVALSPAEIDLLLTE